MLRAAPASILQCITDSRMHVYLIQDIWKVRSASKYDRGTTRGQGGMHVEIIYISLFFPRVYGFGPMKAVVHHAYGSDEGVCEYIFLVFCPALCISAVGFSKSSITLQHFVHISAKNCCKSFSIILKARIFLQGCTQSVPLMLAVRHNSLQ